VALLRKITYNLKHSMGLRHPVYSCLVFISRFQHCCGSCTNTRIFPASITGSTSVVGAMRHCAHGVVWCLLCVTWLIRVYDMTHSCMLHDSFICVTWHGGGAWCGVVSRWDVRRRDGSLRKHVTWHTLICAHASNAIYGHRYSAQWCAYI